jgi:hypothetical protein
MTPGKQNAVCSRFLRDLIVMDRIPDKDGLARIETRLGYQPYALLDLAVRVVIVKAHHPRKKRPQIEEIQHSFQPLLMVSGKYRLLDPPVFAGSHNIHRVIVQRALAAPRVVPADIVPRECFERLDGKIEPDSLIEILDGEAEFFCRERTISR